MIDRKTSFSLLARHLHPVLRAAGFKGSGATLRRISGPLIHIFNVRGSRSAPVCYLNLGVHLAFLPPEGGLPLPQADALHPRDDLHHARIAHAQRALARTPAQASLLRADLQDLVACSTCAPAHP